MPARKPTRLLEMAGAYKKNPQRRRDPEPTSSGPLGDPPERLPEAAVPFWDELLAMAPVGVLQKSDRWSVELAARIMCKIASEPPPIAELLELVKTGELSSADLKEILRRDEVSGAERNMLRSLLAALGLDPVGRSRLSVPTEKPANRYAELAEQARSFSRPN